MGVDITVGQTEHAIKEISKKGFDKDQAAGIRHKELIFTLEAIKEIIKVDTADIFLEVDVSMKVSSTMTQEMEREGLLILTVHK